jgi:hypothetical protein
LNHQQYFEFELRYTLIELHPNHRICAVLATPMMTAEGANFCSLDPELETSQVSTPKHKIEKYKSFTADMTRLDMLYEKPSTHFMKVPATSWG